MSSQTKVETNLPKYDSIKWAIVFLLFAGGIYANYHFAQVPPAIRTLGWLLLACVAGGVALLTAKGQRARVFMGEARTEMRKVVWPNQQETVQTTMLVLAMVVVTSLVLWGIDSILLWAVRLLGKQ